jgi:hypothetical protein
MGRGKRCLFGLLVLMGLIALAEAASYVSFRVVSGQPFSYSRAQRHQSMVPVSDPEKARTEETFKVDIHPFLGFSYNHDWPGSLKAEGPITEWGFTDPKRRSPVRKRAPNKVVVGILGASVASMFSHNGLTALKKELKQSPLYAGKEFEFVSLCVGGWKQPQQVMALNYALALGAEFDVVINIDGLNELAWYKQENARSGVASIYPMGWHWVVGKMPDQEARRQVGKIAYLAEQRAQWAALFRDTPLRWSVTANLIWKLRDRRMQAAIVNTETALRSTKHYQLPYRARGPRPTYRNDDEMLDELVANWERSVLLLDRTCRGNGIRFYQFLQPNQYVPGSKPLTAEEKRVAILEKLEGRPFIEKGYPLLRKAGQRLAKQGVRFADLSMIFARTEKTLYFDTCCHFNRAGNEIMASAIAEALVETPEPPRSPKVHTTLKPAAGTAGTAVAPAGPTVARPGKEGGRP